MTQIRLKALNFAGSPRTNSRTRVVVNQIDAGLKKFGVHSDIWHQAEEPLPMMVPEQRSNFDLITDENLRCFLRKVREADILVWATPVYHGSISGGLKNALDWLSSAILRDKVVGIICHSGGARKMQPLIELRVIARSVGAYVIRNEVATCDEDFMTTENGGLILKSDEINMRLDEFCQELIEFTTVVKLGKSYLDKIRA